MVPSSEKREIKGVLKVDVNRSLSLLPLHADEPSRERVCKSRLVEALGTGT